MFTRIIHITQVLLACTLVVLVCLVSDVSHAGDLESCYHNPYTLKEQCIPPGNSTCLINPYTLDEECTTAPAFRGVE